LKTKSADDIINTVRLIQPSFGGINLEDISQPKCFRVLDTLRADPEVTIPVWHDDQQGTACVIVAGLLNALRIVGKSLDQVKIATVGSGAATIATLRLLLAAGATAGNLRICDSKGLLGPWREDVELVKDEYVDKWRLCGITNATGIQGGIPEAMKGADVVIALSKPEPGTIQKDWVASMAKESIVFVMANPLPEIWPWDAKDAGARIVATGRSDFPNQVNNSTGFPGIFRGTLDVRAKTITDEMCIAAAMELAKVAQDRGLRDDYITPTMDDWEIFPRVATAVAMKAQEQGIARISAGRDELYRNAMAIIKHARDEVQMLMKEGLIPAYNE
jgi:malate dehydrogenase (oxaloacetate-decarboxylating)